MDLQSDAERLSLALAAAKLGDWSWDAASDIVTFSDRAASIFQIPSGPQMTWTAMRALLHPDDADRARIGVERALAERTDYDVEYRLINGTGERWIRASGRGIYDESGMVVGMLGVVQDITPQVEIRHTLRRQADDLRASEERYRAFIDHSSEGIWRLEFDPPIDTTLPVLQQVDLAYANGRLAECNVVMARMYGLTATAELIGKTLDFMLPSTDPDARAYLASIIEAGYKASDVESKEQDARGETTYFSNSLTGIVVDGFLQRVWGTQRSIDDRKRAERAQARLAAIVDSADDAIVAKDLDGIIQSWNSGAERIFGFAADEIVGKPVRTLIPTERESEEDAILARLRGGERIEHFETVRLRKDGTRIHVSLTVSPLRGANGHIIGASKVARDISAQKRAAAELASQQAWFRTTLSSIGDAVIACDTVGSVTFLNGTAASLTGWPEDGALGHPLHEVFNIINETTRRPVDNPVMQVMELGQVVGLANHTILIAKDGTERPIADSAAPIRDPHGSMLGVVLVFRDVSDERRAQAALEQQRHWLETTLESITDAFCGFDHQWRFTYVNRQAEELLGRRRETLLGRDHWTEYPETIGTEVERFYRRAVAEQISVTFEHYFEPHGRWYEINAYPSVEGLAVYFRDVSARKRDEILLRESEHRFRELADAMPQIVWTADPHGQIDYLNQRWTDFTGLPGSVSNEAWGQLLHPDDASLAGARWAAATRSGEAFEMPLRLLDRHNNVYRWHLIRTVASRDSTGQVSRWFGTGTDIHQQKLAESSLRYLAEISAELAGVVDYEATLQKVAELSVPFFADWSAVDLAEPGGFRRLAMSHRDPAKMQVANELLRDYPPEPNAPLGTFSVLRTGKPVLVAGITDEMITKGARDQRHLLLIRSLSLRSYICVPLAVAGEIIGVLTFATAESARTYTEDDLAIANDVARRAAVAIENTRLYEALREADRRKDEFLATLAHELRNPLAPIRNALEILRMPRVAADTVERARAMMERQVQHVVRLVDDLLDVSRVMGGKIELRREPVELAAAIARAVETVQPLIDVQRHELTINLSPDSMLLDADVVRLSQVVCNLLTNAAKYTDPGGHIWVEAHPEADEVILRVRDNGIGLEPQMRARIFDLFVQVDQTTTRSQGGLGIGLTLVKNLVEMHNGSIDALSPGLGQGAEFVVRLPRMQLGDQRGADGDTAPQKQAASTVGRVRVLVVDDNRDAAESFAMLLRVQGHEVRVAFSGPATLAIIKDYAPDIVFLDIGMPGMDGYEVAQRLRQVATAQPMVLVALTGWGQQEDRRRSADSGFDHHLVKPPEPQVVDELLESIINARSARN